jgi:hypothetical protein
MIGYTVDSISLSSDFRRVINRSTDYIVLYYIKTCTVMHCNEYESVTRGVQVCDLQLGARRKQIAENYTYMFSPCCLPLKKDLPP